MTPEKNPNDRVTPRILKWIVLPLLVEAEKGTGYFCDDSPKND